MDLLEQHDGVRGRLGLHTEPLHDLEVAVHLGGLVNVERAGQLFEVYDIGQFGLGEAQDGERAAGGGVPAHPERDDLQRHRGVLGHLDEVLDLLAHHLGTADRAPQYRLVENGPEPGRGHLGQQSLAAHPQLDPPVQLLVADGAVPETDHFTGVGPRLQQARHELYFVVADDGGGGFQADVRLEPVRQEVAEIVPPSGVAGLPGQRQQARPLVGIGDAVQREQVADVPVLEADPAVLHPADLGMRAANSLSGMLGRDLPGLTESAQLSTQHDPLNGRTTRAATKIPDRPLPGDALRRAHRHPSVVDKLQRVAKSCT